MVPRWVEMPSVPLWFKGSLESIGINHPAEAVQRLPRLTLPPTLSRSLPL